jgi:hypothetical protein
MWIVSESLATARSELARLKLRLQTRAGYVPLRNWATFSAPGTCQTRMTVPVSLALARSVPSLLSAS